MSNSILFLILIPISLTLLVGFFIGRGINRKKIINMGKLLERIIKPQDKLYTKLGDVVGFKARYRKEGFRRIEISYLLLPRQSLLILPISFLLLKRDRLFLIIKFFKKFKNPVHLIKKPLEEMKERKWNFYEKINGFYYISNINFPLIKSLVRFKNLRHVAIFRDHLYVSMYPDSLTEEIISEIMQIALKLKGNEHSF